MYDNTRTTEVNMAEMNDTDDSKEEAYFIKSVFYVLIDKVSTGLTVRLNVAKKLAVKFLICVEISHNV